MIPNSREKIVVTIINYIIYYFYNRKKSGGENYLFQIGVTEKLSQSKLYSIRAILAHIDGETEEIRLTYAQLEQQAHVLQPNFDLEKSGQIDG